MILSHEREFIFFRTRKTAGTSIETALSPFCGPDDVISRVTKAEEHARRALGRGAQHELVPLKAYRLWAVKKMIRRRQLPRVSNHMEARQIRPMVTADVWDRYTKMTVVRNPFDAVVSFYYWKTRAASPATRPTLSEFLHSDAVLELTWNWRTYTIADRIVADRICRYENLEADLAEFGASIGLPAPLSLPRAKGSTRADRRDPRDVLSDADVRRVRVLFAREIETFGYEL